MEKLDGKILKELIDEDRIKYSRLYENKEIKLK